MYGSDTKQSELGPLSSPLIVNEGRRVCYRLYRVGVSMNPPAQEFIHDQVPTLLQSSQFQMFVTTLKMCENATKKVM